jgi:hypothetical protein
MPRAPRGAEWSELRRAFAADADDGRVREVRAEPLLGSQASSERLEGPQRDLLLRAAAAAHEMSVPLDVGAMPARDAVVEMGVSHIAEFLERFEIAVNGRGIDLRVSRADLARDLLRRRVVARALERVEDQPALDRHALALRADLVRHAHAATLP